MSRFFLDPYLAWHGCRAPKPFDSTRHKLVGHVLSGRYKTQLEIEIEKVRLPEKCDLTAADLAPLLELIEA